MAGEEWQSACSSDSVVFHLVIVSSDFTRDSSSDVSQDTVYVLSVTRVIDCAESCQNHKLPGRSE